MPQKEPNTNVSVACEDCMDLMPRYPDKYFDLAVVDPPYGIGKNWLKDRSRKNYHETSYENDMIPEKAYFDELFRVSVQQIIWGYNYFTGILSSTNNLIVWDKCKDNNINSQAEIAYSSIHKPVQIIRVPWDGCRMGREAGTKKIHPHQKPIELYIKILRKYAQPGFKILDTHMGSGSSVIACYRLGLDITACEIDPHYYSAAMARIRNEAKQKELFSVQERQSPSLFEEPTMETCV
jgi:site-specific DNA-methyltransferase (adenine-specific)